MSKIVHTFCYFKKMSSLVSDEFVLSISAMALAPSTPMHTPPKSSSFTVVFSFKISAMTLAPLLQIRVSKTILMDELDNENVKVNKMVNLYPQNISLLDSF